MANSRLALIVIGVLLIAQAATPPCCLGNDVKCTGKYKGGLKPSPAELAEILKEHYAWLKAGGSDYKLADDPRRANLCEANLAGADLTTRWFVGPPIGAVLSYADLSDANLYDANLKKAHLVAAQVSKARLSYADLTDAIYAPASEPPDAYVAGIKGLATIKATPGEQIGLIQLRKLLQDAGLRDGARETTFSIQRNITRDQLLSGFGSFQWINGILRIVGLEWTTAYGLHPERALR